MSQSNKSATSTMPGTVFELFAQAAATYSAVTALRADGGRGRAYTYSEMLAVASRVQTILQRQAFAEQQRIGLLAENRPEWPIAYLAILAAGKTVVPIDMNLKPPEIAHIINHAELQTIFTTTASRSLLSIQAPGLTVLPMDNAFNELLSKTAGESSGQNHREDIAALLYTSGTMGLPKAVALTHKNLLSNLDAITRAIHFGPGDIFLSVLPLNHAFESTCGFLSALTRGSTVVYARSLKSKDILEDISSNRVTVMCGVPLLFEKMYQNIQRGIAAAPMTRRLVFHALYALSAVGWRLRQAWGKALFRPIRAKAGLGSVRLLVSGGAALPAHIARFFNLFGIDFAQGYGMTECSPVISVNRLGDICFGSVGVPLDNLEVTIIDPDESGEGEIIVRGDAVTPGYYKNPSTTAELLRDGWLYTGDLGIFRRGHLWITGRVKTVIVSAAGKNIHPEELEEKLRESPYVLESVVFGQNKEGRHGEEVRAIIVPDLEQFRNDLGMDINHPDDALITATITKCVANVNHQVADYKRIVGYTVQLRELDKTSTRKVRRSIYNRHDPSPGVEV